MCLRNPTGNHPGPDTDTQDIRTCCVRFAAVSRLFRGRFAAVSKRVSHVSRRRFARFVGSSRTCVPCTFVPTHIRLHSSPRTFRRCFAVFRGDWRCVSRMIRTDSRTFRTVKHCLLGVYLRHRLVARRVGRVQGCHAAQSIRMGGAAFGAHQCVLAAGPRATSSTRRDEPGLLGYLLVLDDVLVHPALLHVFALRLDTFWDCMPCS